MIYTVLCVHIDMGLQFCYFQVDNKQNCKVHALIIRSHIICMWKFYMVIVTDAHRWPEEKLRSVVHFQPRSDYACVSSRAIHAAFISYKKLPNVCCPASYFLPILQNCCIQTCTCKYNLQIVKKTCSPLNSLVWTNALVDTRSFSLYTVAGV